MPRNQAYFFFNFSPAHSFGLHELLFLGLLQFLPRRTTTSRHPHDIFDVTHPCFCLLGKMFNQIFDFYYCCCDRGLRTLLLASVVELLFRGVD